ncbi:MAG: VOC family protein [Candidatus Korobacteraceae bacterium]|jgi:predicted enzyme related to lactoylglutathione lyase
MKKKAAKKKAVAKKKSAARPVKSVARPVKRATSKPARIQLKKDSTSKVAAPLADEGKLTFNHAMIYVKDVERGMNFYRDWLGFKLIEDFRYEGRPVYARLRAPGGDGTIALHQAGPGVSIASEGVRLYFEVRDLDDFCQKLRKRGFYFTQLPQMMPWGWRHAYLNDPEGHEISLYWAGENRMKKTVMKAAREAGTA